MTLYVPTWWEKRFPWVQDVLIKLDPAPLGACLKVLFGPLRAVVELLCHPLDRGLDAVGRVVRWVWVGLMDTLGNGVRALPLPGFVQDGLWLRPVSLQDYETDSAQMVLRRRSAVVEPVVLMVAVFVHLAAFVFWSELHAADFSVVADELIAIEIPPHVEIPPPPEAIRRPSVPVMATTVVDEDITIAPTTFEQYSIEQMPPPPEAPVEEASDRQTLTPFTVAPVIQNGPEVARLMQEYYPSRLLDAGIGGAVLVWAYVDEEGRVGQVRVAETSGHDSLDAAALKVVDRIRFAPAINRDARVAVWIQLPLEFDVR